MRERSYRQLVTALVATAALGLAGCTSGAGDPAPAGVLHSFPDRIEGWPDEFPEFPPQAAEVATDFIERTFGDGVDMLVHRQRAQLPQDTGAEAVWEHYREALPPAGWEIEELRDDRLSFAGHGAEGDIGLIREADHLEIRVIVRVPRPEPADEAALHLPVPDWYDESLPELPDNFARVEAELSDPAGTGEPITLAVLYQLLGPRADTDFADALAHLREAVPAAGWTFTDEEDLSDEYAVTGRTEQVSHTLLHYRGYGARLTAAVFQHHTESTGAARIMLLYSAEQASP